jgi:hypothetical protein
VVAKTLHILNAGSGPFGSNAFGKTVMESAAVCWKTLRQDPILKRQFHEELCWDQNLDPDTVDLKTNLKVSVGARAVGLRNATRLGA